MKQSMKNRKASGFGALLMALLTTMVLTPALWAQSNRIVRDYGDYVGYDARFADWVEEDPELDVEIWTDNESGDYYEGESIKIYFRSNFDCYVSIYNIDTDGSVNLLYPFDQYDESLIEGGRIYRIPNREDDYDLIVQGPEGVENIQIIASRTPFATPDWYDGSNLTCDNDRDDYMDFINGRYFGCRSGCYRATDRVSFTVNGWDDYYYRPVYHNPWPVWRSYGYGYFDYAWGSSIYIDGFYYGMAPLYLPRISLGHHVVTVYDPYGYCWEGPVTVHHNAAIHLDNTIIRTGAGVKSRYRSVRKSGYREPSRHGYKDVKITAKYKPRVTSKTTRTTTRKRTTTTTSITNKTTRQSSKGKALDTRESSRTRGFGYKRVDRTSNASKSTKKSSSASSSESRRLTPYKSRTDKSASTQKRTTSTTRSKNSADARSSSRESKRSKARSSTTQRKKTDSRSSGSVQSKRSQSSSKSSKAKSSKKKSSKAKSTKAKSSKKSRSTKAKQKTQKKSESSKAKKSPPAKSSSKKSSGARSKSSSKSSSSKSGKKKSGKSSKQ